MTTARRNDDELDIIEEAHRITTERLRAQVAAIEKARDEQPQRIAKARAEADEARGWSLIEEPWESLITTIPAYDSTGQPTGTSLTLPSITAKELFAARLAFDMLDAGLDTETDPDRLEAVKTRYFTELKGDTGLLFLVCMAALDTITSLVVPQMVDELETGAANYFDQGGLAEGVGFMPKNTIKPERVLDPRQTIAFEDAMSRVGAGGVHDTGKSIEVHVAQHFSGHVGDPAVAASMWDRIDALIA